MGSWLEALLLRRCGQKPEQRHGAAEGSEKGAMAGGAGAAAVLWPPVPAPLTSAHPQFLGLHAAQPPACHGVGKGDSGS